VLDRLLGREVWRIADHFDINDKGSRGTAGPVSITALSVTPMYAGKLLAVARRRGRRTHVPPAPDQKLSFRPTRTSPNGRGRDDIPEEMRGHTGNAMLERLVELGLAVTLSERGL
jgi:hypothetical protein